MDKDFFKKVKLLHLVNPAELYTFEEWAEYLEALLNGMCSVQEIDGKLTLFEIRARVDTIRGLSIEIYSKEHAPPHFHVRSANVDASFKIEDCSILKGKISESDYKAVRFWYECFKPKLIDFWDSSRPSRCTVGPYKGN